MLLTVDLERLDVRPGHRLLDAGCGEGRHCFGSLSRGASVVGLDLDFDAMRDASKSLKRRGREQGRLGAMLQGDAFHLPFANGSFDRIICSEVMEHVHDYRAAARELARVARPGARGKGRLRAGDRRAYSAGTRASRRRGCNRAQSGRSNRKRNRVSRTIQ